MATVSEPEEQTGVSRRARQRRPRGVYTITKHRVRGKYSYVTYRLRGTTLAGKRIREQSANRAEMVGLKNQLEIKDANAPDQKPVVSHLTPAQLREAEAAFQRLGGRSLSLAVDFFVREYREPTTDKTIAVAIDEYLAEKKHDVRPATYGPMNGELVRFKAAVGSKRPHEVTTQHVIDFLKSKRSDSIDPKTKLPAQAKPKTWNNARGQLLALFNWFAIAPRKWVAENPVADVKKFKVPRKTPDILSVQQCIDLMQFVQAYKNGAMVPYFVYTLFAGIRPSIRTGEIIRLAKSPKFDRVVNLETGVINITPDVAKGKFVRQLTITDNIRAWLDAFPPDKYPIIPTNYQDMISAIRKKMALPHDVLRHTRISMHVRRCKSIGAAALEAGNTEAVIRQYYLNLVTDADAEVFWDITPASIKPDSATLAKIEAAVAEIEKRKAGGEKEIDAEIVHQIYEEMERRSWGIAEMEDTLYRRHERQGWVVDHPGELKPINF